MKTAMQELKEILENAKKYYLEIKELKKVEAIEDIVMVVEESLKDEKEQITASYHEGFFDGRRWSDKQLGANVDLFYKNGHDYYTQTFKSDE